MTRRSVEAVLFGASHVFANWLIAQGLQAAMTISAGPPSVPFAGLWTILAAIGAPVAAIAWFLAATGRERLGWRPVMAVSTAAVLGPALLLGLVSGGMLLLPLLGLAIVLWPLAMLGTIGFDMARRSLEA